MFDARPSSRSPDLERLIIDTARHIPSMARLFIMAATWLCRYGDMVARHRLRQLAIDELSRDERATLGLLLETAAEHSGTRHFNLIIEACEPTPDPKPLFLLDRSKPTLKSMLKRKASATSKRWGLWTEPFEPRFDALRQTAWIIQRNPTYRERALLKGDLRTSILAVLYDDPQAGISLKHLSECCGATMAAMLDAVSNLELSGRLAPRISRRGRRPENAPLAIRVAA